MRRFTAAEAKNRFGELLDKAQREPVTIEKHGRPAAVMLSIDEYETLSALKLTALRDEIASGLADAGARRTIDGKTGFRQLRRKPRRWPGSR